MSFFLEKFEWKSHFSRREREYFFMILVFRDKNGNTFLSFSCFETRAGNRKLFLKVEWEKMKMIHMGIPGNENFRHPLSHSQDDLSAVRVQIVNSVLSWDNCRLVWILSIYKCLIHHFQLDQLEDWLNLFEVFPWEQLDQVDPNITWLVWPKAGPLDQETWLNIFWSSA